MYVCMYVCNDWNCFEGLQIFFYEANFFAYGVHKVLVGKPEGKRPLGRPRRRWEDNIKMGPEEVGRGCGD